MKTRPYIFVLQFVGLFYIVLDIILSAVSIGVFKLDNIPITVLPGIILIVIGVWLKHFKEKPM